MAIDVSARHGVMLVGRQPELESIRRAVDAARGGRSAAIVIVGEPGIGKSALLAEARSFADGCRVLVSRGVQSESSLAYAGLAELLRPVLDRLGAIPAPQREALEAALALGPPSGGDRLAAYAGTLSLLAAAAEEAPVVCLVDDAHWLDAPSLEAIRFAARRLGHEGVVVLIAARVREHLDLRDSGLPVIELGALGADDSRDLLGRALEGRAPAGWVVDALLGAAAGNPLALRELPGTLTEDQLEGREPLDEPLRPGDGISAAFRERVTRLDPGARWAALLVATSQDGDLGTVLAALAASGGRPGDLETAEELGLVQVDGARVVARHPLLRGLLVESAAARDVRRAHSTFASVVSRDADPERWAWHRAQAAVGPDEDAAAALSEIADRAAERTAYAAAAAGFERAARLTPDAPRRGERLLAAAAWASAAGRHGWAEELAGEAAALGGEPVREPATLIRGTAMLLSGDIQDACATLAGRESDDGPAAAGRLSMAVLAALLTGDTETALRVGRRGALAVQGVEDPVLRTQAHTSLAMATVLAGDARSARESLARLRDDVASLDPRSPDSPAIAVYALAAAYCEDFGAAQREITRGIDGLRAAGMASALPWPLTVAAEVGLRTGRWASALADAQESLTLTEEGGQDCIASYALCLLARLRAGLGMEEDCERDALRAMAIGERTRSLVPRVQSLHALGLLALGLSRPGDAHAHLAELAGLEHGYGTGNPVPAPWRPDMVEACIRLGRRIEAREQLRILVDEARRCGGAWATAAVLRCRGLLAGDDHETHFREALQLHDLVDMPFERARTQLVFGERLRRDRRRAEARTWLKAALDAFDALGARPWSDRAREELDASGMHSRRRDSPVTDRLTPRELQVAAAVAEGATNREAAARLFLSEKTIERHLGNVYRKLGLRSRSQLARRFAASADRTPEE